MHRATVVAAALILAAPVPSALAAHRTHRRSVPRLATGAPPGRARAFAVRPHTIWYTGNNTGILGRLPKHHRAVGKRPGFLHWKTWTRKRAYAVGTLWAKSCVPNCAKSWFSRSHVTVTLSDPRHGHFGKMTLRYTYQGRRVVDTRCNYTGFTYWVLPPLLSGHGCPGPGAT